VTLPFDKALRYIIAKKRGDMVDIKREYGALFPSLVLPKNLSLKDTIAPKKIISGKYNSEEFMEWVVNEDMILLHSEFDTMRASLFDFDTRVAINAMVLSGFTEQEISDNKGSWEQIHLDIYLDSFFSIDMLSQEDILHYLSMINDKNEALIMKQSITSGSKEYLSWVLGLKARRLDPDVMLDEIARGFFIKQKELMLSEKYEEAVKLANVAIKAAKECKVGGGGSATDELLKALENLEFESEEPKIYTLEDLKE
jgi:hypothetical protein